MVAKLDRPFSVGSPDVPNLARRFARAALIVLVPAMLASFLGAEAFAEAVIERLGLLG